MLDSFDSFLRADGWVGWAVAVAVSMGVALLFGAFFKRLEKRLHPTPGDSSRMWKYLLLEGVCATRAWVVFVWTLAFFLAALDGLGRAATPARWILALATCYQFALWSLRAIDNWQDLSIKRRMGSDPTSAGAITLISTVLKGLALILIALVGLGTMGVNVAAVIASLGVGGIAVALAAQNILGDLLASVSILLDKPFVVGDFIVVGDKMGSVETIGIKTTRLRSLAGEQIVFSNKDLLESRIQNFKSMWQRRVVLRFSARANTPPEILESIPGWIKVFVTAEPKLRLDRCHLAAISALSMDFELVFFVLDSDYGFYMDVQQRIFLQVLRKFRAEGVEFALPEQRVRVESETRSPDIARPLPGE